MPEVHSECYVREWEFYKIIDAKPENLEKRIQSPRPFSSTGEL